MVFPYGQEAERWSGYVIDFEKKKKKPSWAGKLRWKWGKIKAFRFKNECDVNLMAGWAEAGWAGTGQAWWQGSQHWEQQNGGRHPGVLGLPSHFSSNLARGHSPQWFPSRSLHCHLSGSVWISLATLSRDLIVQQLVSKSVPFGQRAAVPGGVVLLGCRAWNHPSCRTSPASLLSHSPWKNVCQMVAEN